mmetsp:Transcript_57889/g.134873  ORF Transcript_57889/g.134873 Transcript_57889/m.134873 type:complete len:185 (-) Transcript_57889:52-606(-)|eukprot:CAMPEP_0171091712 /NCGR_PEP_ID=MMETSP0766_2-20121228/34982_1 /TAXON_ID=439317 /ORGANISM="Gambierdiscus australes, Strain CAWD 149" /LENGTH=184 /DNA_ID=CAMNT_0011549861 /DNA_START=63 /DNA_END=617 /DNA_ORIENTATION=+
MSQAQPSVESFLGTPIRVVTTFGEEIEGELFCVDSSGSNSVVICQRLESGNVNYRWTKTNIIREVSALAAPPACPADDWLPHVDLRHIESRAKKLEDEAREESKRYGVGVTEHAQEIFDALSKTMEAEWDGEDIKVLGVRISKPYDPFRNVTGGDDQARERVQKVLQNELGRLSKRQQQMSQGK